MFDSPMMFSAGAGFPPSTPGPRRGDRDRGSGSTDISALPAAPSHHGDEASYITPRALRAPGAPDHEAQGAPSGAPATPPSRGSCGRSLGPFGGAWALPPGGPQGPGVRLGSLAVLELGEDGYPAVVLSAAALSTDGALSDAGSAWSTHSSSSSTDSTGSRATADGGARAPRVRALAGLGAEAGGPAPAAAAAVAAQAIRAEAEEAEEALRAHLAIALELLGEREEALEELRSELSELRIIYREHVAMLTASTGPVPQQSAGGKQAAGAAGAPPH